VRKGTRTRAARVRLSVPVSETRLGQFIKARRRGSRIGYHEACTSSPMSTSPPLRFCSRLELGNALGGTVVSPRGASCPQTPTPRRPRVHPPSLSRDCGGRSVPFPGRTHRYTVGTPKTAHADRHLYRAVPLQSGAFCQEDR
jgi:hypothetical protein